MEKRAGEFVKRTLTDILCHKEHKFRIFNTSIFDCQIFHIQNFRDNEYYGNDATAICVSVTESLPNLIVNIFLALGFE